MIAIKIVAGSPLLATAANHSAHSIIHLTSPHTCQVAPKSHKQLVKLALQLQLNRTLVQSTSKHQKVTNTNQQQHQLIPIARNIYFRQCNEHNRLTPIKPTQAAYSIVSDYSYAHPYVATADNPSVFGYPHADETTHVLDIDEHHQSESTLDRIKRKARGAVSWDNNSNSNEGNTKFYGQIFNRATVATSASSGEKKQLVVLMSWLEAREKHIEKYRQYYLERGYDVLNVKTSPLDLLLPTIGAKKISKDFVKFLAQKQYNQVVLHGFSVGGYQFGEFLLELDRQDSTTRDQILNSIKGLVFDSLVPIEGACIGVANSITTNKILAKFFEHCLRIYMLVGHNIATKYYLKASEKVWSGPLNCPSLFFFSKDDTIADYEIIERLSDVWINNGIDVERVMFESSPHVQHFTNHKEKYTSKLQKFLESIKST